MANASQVVLPWYPDNMVVRLSFLGGKAQAPRSHQKTPKVGGAVIKIVPSFPYFIAVKKN